ncbi:MAG: hypothetical protein C0597_10780 [Marinilabiliales bacterium]|nr:MAG: hypothetical protein C0597_10780 [Marinilabiliales bacterium]
MQYKKFSLIIYLISLSLTTISQNKSEKIHFISPVDIPMYLSGNFGEIRSTHFHAGIDIKTQGVIGKKIYAVANGYISRIKISTNSYGKTIYINHPNGYTTVYGHLSKFSPDLDRFVKEIQYKNEAFEINYFPKTNELSVKKGELIGYSGNSGSSLGPHLHFEVRETNNQIPVNPLLFNFKIKDNISPVLYNLTIYPLEKSSTINGNHFKKTFPLESKNGYYVVADSSEIVLSGNIGFGIEMYDFLNGSRNKCGIYTLTLNMDSLLIYEHIIDKFSFYEGSLVKGHVDYAEKVKTKKTIQKMFILPNNNLSIYKSDSNSGIIEFKEDSTYNLRLIATDVYGNKSELNFYVKGSEPKLVQNDSIFENYIQMNWNEENKFEDSEIVLQIPKNALFDNLSFSYSKSEPDFKAYSALHHVHNIYTPLQKSYSLAIQTKQLPNELKEKAFIAEILEEEINSIGGTVLNGNIVAESTTFGDFVVLVDTISPEIVPLSDFNNLKKEQLSFKIYDELTGIKSYNGYIDNLWALFEYDEKNDLLFYKIDLERIEKGIEHELELFVIDNMNNISTFYKTFYW